MDVKPDLSVFGIPGIGEIERGAPLADIIGDAIVSHLTTLVQGDIVVVTHKVISKAEGRFAKPVDGSVVEIVENEASAILRRRGELTITRTRHGFICANAGVDRSNVPGEDVVLLPLRPDRSAASIRNRLMKRFGTDIAVVVTDTFGRAWRRGLVDVAIGIAGLPALIDHRGKPDHTGRIMEVTEVAIIDEIAAAADLVMGKATSIPVAVMRGLHVGAQSSGNGKATDLVRSASEDFFL
ncbi:MAG: coenzyme F420-0:L-glutamate ligase [Acidimicrobiia bacterium]|nr:coenzyme F420-0:L-glutamate ligase [Acidimicrobiia bacterium]